MMMFWQAALVMLAVPKTGTQAWQAALGAEADMIIRQPPESKHMRARRFEHRLRPLLERGGPRRLQTFAVIRDPIDWRASWYRYRARPALAGQPASTRDVSFAEFVEATLAETPPPFARIGSQARFVSDDDGRVIVDHLRAYEDQEGVRRFLSERLARAVEMPARRNVSPAREVMLPAALEARLRRAAAAEFALHDRAREAAGDAG